MSMGAGEMVFFVVAGVAVVSALGVVLHPSPVYCALSLIVTLFQIAVLFLLLDAQMVAFLQILVYAGAIMVLFLFVIMLLNPERDVDRPPHTLRGVIAGVGGLFAAELAWFFLRRGKLPQLKASDVASNYGSVAALGRSLYTDHALSFELTSVLLLVAVVGAVVLARKGGD